MYSNYSDVEFKENKDKLYENESISTLDNTLIDINKSKNYS